MRSNFLDWLVSGTVRRLKEFAGDLETTHADYAGDDFDSLLYDEVMSRVAEMTQFAEYLEGLSMSSLSVEKVDEILGKRNEVVRRLESDYSHDNYLFKELTSVLNDFLTSLKEAALRVPIVLGDIYEAISVAEARSEEYAEDDLEPGLDDTIFALEGIAQLVEKFENVLDPWHLTEAKELLENDVNTDLVHHSEFSKIQQFLESLA